MQVNIINVYTLNTSPTSTQFVSINPLFNIALGKNSTRSYRCCSKNSAIGMALTLLFGIFKVVQHKQFQNGR